LLRSFSFSSPFVGGGVGFRKGPAPPSAEGDLAAGERAGRPAAGRATPVLPSSRRPPIQARSASSIAPVFFAPEVSSRFVLSCEFPIHRVGSLFFRSMLMLAFLVHVPVVSLALFAGAVLCGLSSRCVLLSPLVVSSSSLACAACIGFVLLVFLFHPSFVPLHLCLVLILCILSLIGVVPVGRIVLGHLLLQFVRRVLPFTLCSSFMFDAHVIHGSIRARRSAQFS